jgi:TRAP-type transport system small permease protein
VDKLESGLLAANRWALIGLLAAMSVIIFTNVALRYLTNQSIEWAEEVARHMMIWLTFVGAGPVLRYGGHIAIDNLQDAVPQRAAQALRWLVVVLLFVFFVFMVVWGAMYVDRAQYQTTAATQISFGWIYAAMPIGGLLLLAHGVFIVRGYLRERKFAADEHFDANASASL